MASNNIGTCPGCCKEFNLRGLPNHQKKCLRTTGRRQQDLEFEANRQAQCAVVPSESHHPHNVMIFNRGLRACIAEIELRGFKFRQAQAR